MIKFSMLLLSLFLMFSSLQSFANDCTKDEVLRFIDKEFSKNEINKICNKAKESKVKTSNLTKKLISAMTIDPETNERVGDSGETIQAYIKNGSLGKSPNVRADYTDYWEIKDQADFMGHTLVVIEEEYMSKYIGCCVSPGIGVTVRINHEISELKDFAKKNKCSFTSLNQLEFDSEFGFVGIKASKDEKYASLSCRERDANN